MTKSEDFAIVIGISRYPELQDVPGAEEDARAMAAWLTDSSGGGLDPDHLTLITSNTPGRPTREDVDNAFEPIVNRIFGAKDSRIGRRLYIYMTGHGIGSSSDDVALLMANASRTSLGRSVSAKAYTEFFRSSGAFEEIVAFLDCGRDFNESAVAGPPWRSRFPTLGQATAFFYAYASGAGAAAFSSHEDGPAHGFFTRAVLEGLRGAAAGPDNVVTGQSLISYVMERVGQLTGGKQRPEFTMQGPHPIVFGASGQGSRQKEDSQAEKPAAAPNERVVTQADDPAMADRLNRRPFAEVIGKRIEEIRHGPGAFMIHIHGPWGSGKTSVLNFLRAYLQRDPKRSRRWIVVDFNAWQQQRIRPPWWTLISEIYAQSVRQLGLGRAVRLRVRWLIWKVRADWVPVIITIALVITAVLLGVGVIVPGADAGAGNAAAKGIQTEVKTITVILTALGAVFTFTRSLAFGSARAAQAYAKLRTDPLRPIVRLFKRLIDSIRRPVVVFIDDLDRCEPKYVVALLEGIQTLFRTASVVYVIAADRRWICTSFEKSYEDFGQTVGEPGRPLGYLFLDKMFQVSAAVPRVSPDMQQSFWRELLRSTASGARIIDEASLQHAEKQAEVAMKDLHTQEQMNAKIAEASGDPVREQAMRAAAAKQITSAEASRETEHRLARFAGLLEPNPRSMKRLVNAYGLHQAAHFLESRHVPPEALARWTIIELRWPLLSDLLTERPHLIADLANGKPPEDRSIAKEMKKLFSDAEVKAVIEAGLDEATIRQIAGLPEGSPRKDTASAAGAST